MKDPSYNYLNIFLLIYYFMRFKVSLVQDGREFYEIIIANNKQDAVNIALKNNPTSKVINSSWVFKL